MRDASPLLEARQCAIDESLIIAKVPEMTLFTLFIRDYDEATDLAGAQRQAEVNQRVYQFDRRVG